MIRKGEKQYYRKEISFYHKGRKKGSLSFNQRSENAGGFMRKILVGRGLEERWVKGVD